MIRPDRPLGPDRLATWRHPWPVRLTHWVNVICLVFLLMTGLQILKAHPHLYWGLDSTFDDAWLSFGTIPGWMTLPGYRDLAAGRNWHFFFAWIFVANGMIYLLYILFSGRLARMIEPSREELAHLPDSVIEHAQSARTLHFIAAMGITAFAVVHVLLVFLSGPVNNVRAMITGWYVIRTEPEPPKETPDDRDPS